MRDNRSRNKNSLESKEEDCFALSTKKVKKNKV